MHISPNQSGKNEEKVRQHAKNIWVREQIEVPKRRRDDRNADESVPKEGRWQINESL